jgi:hypothetical protein
MMKLCKRHMQLEGVGEDECHTMMVYNSFLFWSSGA